jgi:hypothetical protein
MTNEQMDKILEHALSEDSYLDRLLADPRTAVAEHGATLSDDEVATVKGMSKGELRSFAQGYRSATDPGRRRAAC